MHHQVTFSEIEEALDGPGLVLADGKPTRGGRRLAAEKFLGSNDGEIERDETKAGANVAGK
jgi:hypothetical protein